MLETNAAAERLSRRMSLVKLSLKHGQTIDEAQRALEQAVGQVSAQFTLLIDRVQWDAARRHVDIQGKGFEIHMQLDEQEVHVEADIPILGKLLGNQLLTGVKKVLEHTFQKPAQLENDAGAARGRPK
jgi:hypothetical protein